jgi:eukaryotic-like serine/threonine-protein kinase
MPGQVDPCPSDTQVDAFAAGNLPASEQRALEPHLDRCATCKQRLLRLVTRTSALPEDPAATSLLTAATTPVTARALQGRRLGRYLILEDVGAGAMGVVYAAYDTVLDRKVALKFLTGRGTGEAPAARVLAEAAAMARLSHPNVVTVHDVGSHEGLTYLSMELVDGVNLATWRHQQPRSYRQIAQVMAAAARGLAAAHAAGIVHRDVKPQNILVAGDRVLVTDFGVAMRTEAGGDGNIAGTPAYMAPEQFRGDRLDPRTDVFCFCATLYEMLHGERAFAGTSRNEVQAQVTEGRIRPVPAGSRVPGRLHRLALRGLDPDPDRRPADLATVADELLTDPAARRRHLTVAAVVAVTLVVAFWGGGYLKAHPERQCRAGAELMNQVWNQDLQARVQRRYIAAAAGAAWPVLQRRLDEYSGRWRAIYGETCAATLGKRLMSDDVFDLRLQCLHGQRASIETFIAALSSARPDQLVKAAGAVLPSLGDCELSARPETKPRPTDPGAVAQMTAIEKDIARSLAEQNLGDYTKSVAHGKQAVAAARKLGYEPLLAAALNRLGMVEKQRGAIAAGDPATGLPAATKLFEEGYTVAEVGRDDRQRLVAARENVLVQLQQTKFPEAQRWATLAEAVLARLGKPVAEESALQLSLGWLHYHEGHNRDARAAFGRALELARKSVPVDHRRVVAAQGVLCSLEDGDVQIACFRRVLELGKTAYGPEHPEMGVFYANLGLMLSYQAKHHAEGCQLMQRALEMWKGDDQNGPNVIKNMVNLAVCVEEEGKISQAQALYEEALRRKPSVAARGLVLERYGLLLANRLDVNAGIERVRAAVVDFVSSRGASHDDTMSGRTILAMLLRDAGRLEEALRELDDAIALARKDRVMTTMVMQLHAYRSSILVLLGRPEAALRSGEEAVRVHKELGGRPGELCVSLHAMAMAQLQLGRANDALAKLERALVLVQTITGDSPDVLADIQFGLALVLNQEREDRKRACTLASEAAVIYRRFLRKRPQQLQTERWLTRQGCTTAS